jgi:hypothetical protein
MRLQLLAIPPNSAILCLVGHLHSSLKYLMFYFCFKKEKKKGSKGRHHYPLLNTSKQV